MDNLKQNLSQLLGALYLWGNRLTGGTLGIVITTIQRFGKLRSPEVAASMAYYFLFSLFPLLIFLVILGSFVLEEDRVRDQVFNWLVELFPTAASLIERNLELVIARRGPAGITAIIGLLWAGSGAFNILARSINRAWPNAEMRNFFEGRLVALLMMVVVAMLFCLSLVSNTIFSLLPPFDSPLWNSGIVYNAFTRKILTDWSSWFFAFLMFLSMYRWIPNTKVSWWEAGWGALIATLGWRWAINMFAWYLDSGLSSFHLVYGTLATVIALMFWIYISSLITLFGAHLSAAVAIHTRLKNEQTEED
jgi:membrane protein